MTIKQILLGSMLGVAALGASMHRMPKQPVQGLKPLPKSAVKVAARVNRPERKRPAPVRLSLNKVYG